MITCIDSLSLSLSSVISVNIWQCQGYQTDMRICQSERRIFSSGIKKKKWTRSFQNSFGSDNRRRTKLLPQMNGIGEFKAKWTCTMIIKYSLEILDTNCRRRFLSLFLCSYCFLRSFTYLKKWKQEAFTCLNISSNEKWISIYSGSNKTSIDLLCWWSFQYIKDDEAKQK